MVNESQESTVRLPPLQLDSNPLAPNASSSWIPLQMPRWTNTLYHYWRRSLLHDTFSISLPIAEENEFEEKFKYLIATSPLLSEVLSVHNANKSNKKRATHHMTTTTTDYSTMATKASHAGVVGTVTTMTGCMMALAIEAFKLRHQLRQQSQPAKLFLSTPVVSMTMMLTSSMSVFFGYRHMRRSGIRQLYRTALHTLQTLMEQCETLDNKVHRALITIQEIELVSRGYRLSLPLSPISRIEQSSRSRRCIALRNRLGAVLRRAFIVYEEAIIDLVDHVNKNNLSRLYDMYNIRSVASLSAVDRMDDDEEEGGICLDRLRALAQLMHAKRRECMMQLLALDIVTDEHDSLRLDYERGWRGVNTVLAKVTEDTKQFVNEITKALDNELYKPTAKDDRQQLLNSNTVQDGRLRPFVHRLASLDQQMRTVEAKFYLCNDDIRQLTQQGDSTSLEELRERLKREYMSIEQDFNQMIVEWEAGRDALTTFLDPPDLDPSPSSSISSPTTSQKEEEDDISSTLVLPIHKRWLILRIMDYLNYHFQHEHLYLKQLLKRLSATQLKDPKKAVLKGLPR